METTHIGNSTVQVNVLDVRTVYQHMTNAMPATHSQDLYDEWVAVWRHIPSTSVAADMIANRNTYFGEWTPERVNFAIKMLSECLEGSRHQASAYDHAVLKSKYHDIVDSLVEAAQLLANPEANLCWDMLNDEHKSFLLVTAAT